MSRANAIQTQAPSAPTSLAEFQSHLLESLPKLRRFAGAYCKTSQDADDAVQLTCERALTRWRQWTGKGPLEHWLVKILANVWRDEARSRKLRSGPSLDCVPEPSVDSADAANAAYLDQVLGEVMRLPAGQRDVLLLVAGEGLSYRETAQRLHVPVGTVMSRLCRGRKALGIKFGGDAIGAAAVGGSASVPRPMFN